MMKYVPALSIEDDDTFPYLRDGKGYTEELLRSRLYSAWWTVITDDHSEELALLMDYDGFVEWYNSKVDEWMLDDSAPSEPFTADEYLRYHLGVTITAVREVSA